MDLAVSVSVMRTRRCGAVLMSVLLLCTAATSTNIEITLLPRNLTVREGEEATFTCRIPCSHDGFWYIGDLFNSNSLPFIDNVPGITYRRSFPEGVCDFTDPGTYIDSLIITARAELNNVAVQCSASMIVCEAGDDSCGAIMYSRYRLLRVESEEPPSPSPSSPEPSSPPSCPPIAEQQPTPCPAPSPVTVTSTETSVSTTTSTHTETQRMTVTHTAILKPPAPTPTGCTPSFDSSDAQTSPTLLKGLGLTSAVVVAAILVIVPVLFHL